VSRRSTPSVAVVITVYNGEEYVAEALTSILGQTRPPDEVIVVDDGSTDGTQRQLERFADDIRVIAQANQGHAGALNRGYAEARCDYIGKCDADDIWEPDKLSRQVQALVDHPDIDVAFSGARNFGLADDEWVPAPGEGLLLDARELVRALYRTNIVCATSTVIRRETFERLGPFDASVPCEDYDYWLRALAAGAVFFYDPRVLVRCRKHALGATHNLLRMRRGAHLVRQRHAELVADERLVRGVLAGDLSTIARLLVDDDQPREARATFVASVRRRPTAFALAWLALLAAPSRYRATLIDTSRSIKRGVQGHTQAAAR
jgi:glycosyltransferase involved in cell wall biosynthesis